MFLNVLQSDHQILYVVQYIENTCIWFNIQRILGSRLLISSLLGALVKSQGLPSDSTCILKAEPGKLDIKGQEPGILFISLQVNSLFKLAIMT